MIIRLCMIVIMFISTCSVHGASVNLSRKNEFTVDPVTNQFMMNNRPFRYVSGSIHYFRIPNFYWRDRLRKVKYAGLNAIEFYIPWNFHEFEEGQYDFSGDRNVTNFLTIAQELGLFVILRPGPYICGEWDFGGFPAWLLRKNPHMRIRTSAPDYIEEVDKWFAKLLPMLKPHLFINGGNIISIQVENEYGSYGVCDDKYMRHLTDTLHGYLGEDVFLFTTDGFSIQLVRCGSTDRRVFTTVDFGTGSTNNLNSTFSGLLQYQPRGPFVNSEYYTGWLDSWKSPHHTVSTDSVVNGLKNMINYQYRNVSVNMYMIHGGTNFGFWNGANSPPFNPQITSYDYNAPITEAGDMTWKYEKIRSLMSQHHLKFANARITDVPRNITRTVYPSVYMKYQQLFLQQFLKTSPSVVAEYPQYMETLRHYQGYMFYISTLNTPPNQQILTQIQFDRISDNAYIFTTDNDAYIDLLYMGMLRRGDKNLTVTGFFKSKLIILVENAGHVNFGGNMFNDIKGIIGNVHSNGYLIKNWKHIPMSANDIYSTVRLMENNFVNYIPTKNTPNQARLYTGELYIGTTPGSNKKVSNDSGCCFYCQDTFVELQGVNKGILLINGHHLGRYYNSVGPQLTLFVPCTVLNSGSNQIVIFELEGTSVNQEVQVKFQNYPIWKSFAQYEHIPRSGHNLIF